MSNEFISVDEKSRNSIISDINTNLFVEAGAGSGKTTMLVNRMVAMIENGIPVEKICAITFTKNAALEFYDRFEAKLIERSNSTFDKEPEHAGDLPKPNELTRKRCLDALQDIDLCFMGTIDSFCNMILSEHPIEANIPSDARLISNQEAKDLYTKFFIETINGKYDSYNSELSKYAKRFVTLFYNPEEVFSQLMSEIMDRRNIDFHVNENLCIDFFKCFSSVRKDTKKVLNVFNKDLSKIIVELSKTDTREPLDVYTSANEILQKGWQYNFTGVLRAVKDISKLTYKASTDELGFTNESIVRNKDNATILNFADEDNPDALLFKLRNYRYQNSLKFILMCVKPLEELMREEGKFTFFDYLYYLRNMLVNDAKNSDQLINYIYNRHSYFLIDEFQDTNPLQSEVFFYLTASDTNKDVWWKCIPKPGSLFIVGDPKQSIYRFRSADVASYLNVKKIFENPSVGKVLYLVNNFRSKNIVKKYFNDVFDDVMKEENVEQSKYLDIQNISGNEQEEFNGIYTYQAYSDSLLGSYPEMEDNKQLAKIVKTLVGNQKTKIYDKSIKDLRPLKFSDIMIIFPTKMGIAPCINEFEKQAIPIRVEGKVLFEDCTALKTVLSIYKVLCDNEDYVSLITCLYSPVFGFNENDLAKYRLDNHKIQIDLNSEYENSDIEVALNKLANSAKQIRTLTPSSLYEKIIDDYEIFKYVSSDRLEIVYYVLELIRSEEKNGTIVTFEDAITYVENLLAGESGVERCLSLSQNLNAVHIANLHKVKGLEAPVVILAKAGSASTNPSIRIEYNTDSNGTKADGYVVSITDRDNSLVKVIETNEFKEESEKEKTSLKLENERLVYVAATRAKNVLIICDGRRAGANQKPVAMGNKWKVLKDKATSGDFFETFGDNADFKEASYNEVSADSLYKEFKQTPIIVKGTYSLRKPSDIQSTSKVNDETYENEKIDNTYSTLIGTMVHRLLEIIVISKDGIEKEKIINNILDEYLNIETKNYEIEFRNKLNKVYDQLHNGGFNQKGTAPKDILDVILNADEVYSEVPFTYKKDDVITNGIIDLIYEKDNELHIIDWKTNKDDVNLDEHYKDQLENYKLAIKEIAGKDVTDALIYHISLND